MQAPGNQIAHVLEAAYRDFHKREHRPLDAIHPVYAYEDPRDREVMAFLSALLAYGNVKAILSSIGRLAGSLSPAPHRGIRERRWKKKIAGFRHRFTSEEDIDIVLSQLADILDEHGTIERFFTSVRPREDDFALHLSAFVRAFRARPVSRGMQTVVARRQRTLKYLLSDPLDGSACKRLNLFLRWVIRRNDGIDLGIWSSVSPARLFLPVDTHLLKTIRALGWTRSKTANWRVVVAATEELRKYDAHDPVRFDFSLCHLSMRGGDIRSYLASLADGDITEESHGATA